MMPNAGFDRASNGGPESSALDAYEISYEASEALHRARRDKTNRIALLREAEDWCRLAADMAEAERRGMIAGV